MTMNFNGIYYNLIILVILLVFIIFSYIRFGYSIKLVWAFFLFVSIRLVIMKYYFFILIFSLIIFIYCIIFYSCLKFKPYIHYLDFKWNDIFFFYCIYFNILVFIKFFKNVIVFKKKSIFSYVISYLFSFVFLFFFSLSIFNFLLFVNFFKYLTVRGKENVFNKISLKEIFLDYFYLINDYTYNFYKEKAIIFKPLKPYLFLSDDVFFDNSNILFLYRLIKYFFFFIVFCVLIFKIALFIDFVPL